MNLFRTIILQARKPRWSERIYLAGVFFIWWTTIYSQVWGLMLGNDDRYPLNAVDRLRHWQHAYSDFGVPYLAHGGLWPFKIATLFPSVSINAFFQWVGLPYHLCQRIEYGFLLGFLFFGTYWLGKKLFRSPHAGYFALLGVYSAELKFHFHISRELFYAWAITPFLVVLMIILIEKTDKSGKVSLKSMLAFSLCSLLIAPGAVNFPLFLAAIFFGLTITALIIFKSSNKIPVFFSVIGALIFTLIAHSFWIIPSIYSFEEFTGSLQYDNVGWARTQAELNSFPAVLLRLRLDIGNFGFPALEMGEFGTGLLGFAVMLGIGGYSIVRRITILNFLFAMFLIFVFLGKSVRGPMGYIFLDLPHVLPLIEWFRSAYDKFSLPQTFLYSMFLGGGICHILVWAQNRAWQAQGLVLLFVGGLTLFFDRAFQSFYLLAAPVLLAFFSDFLGKIKISQVGFLTPLLLAQAVLKKWPFWIACIAAALLNPFVYNINLTLPNKDFPKEYETVKEIIQRDKDRFSYKLVMFPLTTIIQGKDFLTAGSYNLFEEISGMGMENQLSDDLTNRLSLNNPSDFSKFKKEVQIGQVKYIVIAKDAFSERIKKEQMDKFYDLLSSDPDFRLELNNSRVALFSFLFPTPIVEFLRPEFEFYRLPIHMKSYLHYKLSPTHDGEILMRRPFSNHWKLRSGDEEREPTKRGGFRPGQVFMAWFVKANREYEIYYSLDKKAQVGKWVSLSYVIFSLVWLAWRVWGRKTENLTKQ